MEMAFLGAERKIVIVNAELKAIEQAIEEEDTAEKSKLQVFQMLKAKNEHPHDLTQCHQKHPSREPIS